MLKDFRESGNYQLLAPLVEVLSSCPKTVFAVWFLKGGVQKAFSPIFGPTTMPWRCHYPGDMAVRMRKHVGRFACLIFCTHFYRQYLLELYKVPSGNNAFVFPFFR